MYFPMPDVPNDPIDTVSVLHVDNYAAFTELTAEFLEGSSGSFAVETTRFASDALDVVAGGEVDCIVSGYELPATDGLSFRERVRDVAPWLPFVLFTAVPRSRLDEAALERDGTVYLRKGTDHEQFGVLADRIEHAVASTRGSRETHRAARDPWRTSGQLI